MAFSDDAIGFYLQLDDQLTPVLKGVTRDYSRMVKSIEKFNVRLARAADKGMGALAKSVEMFTSLPRQAKKGYTEALRELRKKIRPVTQKINLEFTVKSKKEIGRLIGDAVSKALSKAKVRLAPAFPEKKSKLFDTSVALRGAYKEDIQPPDMAGTIKVPGFAEGGIVKGGNGEMDDVLAMLTKGEMVLPKEVADTLKAAAARFMSAKGGTDAPAFIKEIGEAMKKAQPPTDKLNDEMDRFNESGEEAQGIYTKLLKRILSPVRFLAIHKALETVQEGMKGLMGTAGQALQTLDGQQVLGFVDAMNNLNRTLGLSREELRDLKARSAAAVDEMGGGIVTLSEFAAVMRSGADEGQKNVDVLLELTKISTLTAAATDASGEALQKMAVELQDRFGFSTEQIAASFAHMKTAADATFSHMAQLVPDTQASFERMGAFFRTQAPKDQAVILKTMVSSTAAMQNAWVDAGGTISTVFQSALSGNIEAGVQFNKLTGRNFQELQAHVLRGDISPILESMAERMEPFAANAEGAERALEALGLSGVITSAQMIDLLKNKDAIVKKTRELQNVSFAAGEATEFLTKKADANIRTFDKLRIRIVNAASAFEVLGVSGAEVADFITEFNPLVALSSLQLLSQTGMMGKAWGLTKKLGSGFLNLGKSIVSTSASLVVSLAKGIASAVKGLASLAFQVVLTGARFIGMAIKGIAAAIIAFAGLVVPMAVAIGQFIVLNAAMLLNPFVLVGVAVVGLVTGIVLLLKHFGLLEPIWEGIKVALSGVGDAFVFVGSLIGTTFGFVVKLVKFQIGVMSALFTRPGEVMEATWETIKNAFVTGVEFVSGMVSRLTAFLGLDAAVEGAKSLFSSILGIVSSPIEAIKSFVNTAVIDPINLILKWKLPVIGNSLASMLSLGLIPKLQGGGIVTRPTVAMAGEAGPEAVIPLTGPAQVMELQQRLTSPLISAATLREAITVQLDPATTDRPVLAAVLESNALLKKMLGEMRGVAGARAGAGAKGGVSEETRGLGRGQF